MIEPSPQVVTPLQAAKIVGVSPEYFERFVRPHLEAIDSTSPLIPVAGLRRWVVGRLGDDLPVDRVLTVEEAAERVRVSARTVMRAIRAGQLQASQLNQGRGGWRIYESAIDAWMGARCNVGVGTSAPRATARAGPMPRRSSGQQVDGRLRP